MAAKNCGICMAIIFMYSSRVNADANSDAIQFFSDELQSKISNLTDRYNNGPIRYISDTEYDYSKPNPATHDRVRTTTKKDGSKYLSVSDQLGGSTKIQQICQGFNVRYYFELKKNRQNTAWLLSRIHGNQMPEPGSYKSPVGVDLFEEIDEFINSFGGILTVDGMKSPKNISELPSFKVTNFARDKPNSRVTIAFNYLAADKFTKQQTTSTCELEITTNTLYPSYKFSQNHNFEGVKVTHRWQQIWNKTEGSVTTGTCILDSVRTDKSGPNDSSFKSALMLDTGSIPDVEFSLASFGIPEPPGFEPKSTPLYVWLLVVAGIGFALFVIFRFLATRR